MNRYDHGFRTYSLAIQENGLQRVQHARGAILQHRNHGFGPGDDDEIVRQFDISGMVEYWGLELSEPMACFEFARILANHFFVIVLTATSNVEDIRASGPAALRVVEIKRAGILSALRAARADKEPWFMAIPEPPKNSSLDENYGLGFVPRGVVVVPPEPPSDGIDLSKLKVRPRAAAEWLLAMPMRRHLVPPSLAAVLQPETPRTPQAVSSKRGRPEGTSFARADRVLAESMNTMVAAGTAASPTAAAWVLIGRDGSGAHGSGTPNAKVKRLVGVAKDLRTAQNNAD